MTRAATWILALFAIGAAGCPDEPEEHDEHAEREAHDEKPEGDPSVVELPAGAAARADIEVAPAEPRALSGILSTTGRVDFDQDRLAHVSVRIQGRVHEVRAALGDRVEAEEVLAVIDSIALGRAKSALLQARAELELTRRTLERERGLLEDKITSEQAVLEARAAHRRALAAYQAARRELRLLGLSKAEIASTRADQAPAALFPLESPIAGTVVEKHIALGEVVTPERSLFTVADLSRVWIWIDVYERDLARVHLEDEVMVKVEAYPDRVFEGQVAFLRAQVDPATRTARARIDVPNPERRLRPGMFAEVTVTDPHGEGEQAAPERIVIPAAAVQRDGARPVVFVALGERRYARRRVRLGRRTESHVEVLEGLSAGDPVVVEGAFLLKSEMAEHRMGGGHSH